MNDNVLKNSSKVSFLTFMPRQSFPMAFAAIPMFPSGL